MRLLQRFNSVFHDLFTVLGWHAILPQDVQDKVNRMTALVEFRNLLVYEHCTVDDMMVYGFAKKRLNDFADFSRAVRTFLEDKDLLQQT